MITAAQQAEVISELRRAVVPALVVRCAACRRAFPAQSLECIRCRDCWYCLACVPRAYASVASVRRALIERSRFIVDRTTEES